MAEMTMYLVWPMPLACTPTAASTYPEDYESVVEAYYNAKITLWFVFGPNIQYVANPGGSNTAKDAVVFGLRAQITF